MWTEKHKYFYTGSGIKCANDNYICTRKGILVRRLCRLYPLGYNRGLKHKEYGDGWRKFVGGCQGVKAS